ncbi:MoxR family ATPase [Candidatus Woesearchaeota archaeon]|nr:MoxR family ATPase [Candidatus Woesearchaeota archaeon]
MGTKVSSSEISKIKRDLDLMRGEISRIVVGQDEVVNGLIRAILTKGHVLLEGVPGIAKTLIMRALAHVTTSNYNRVQFTADLLPTDITGITAYDPHKGFYVVKGPVFTNFLLADEINRAPAKVQSALLEAMQEKQVTIGTKTFIIEEPFFVLATQNPIESVAIFPLPEAQMDRFLFKLYINYPSVDEEQGILQKNISISSFDDFKIKSVISSKEIIKMQEVVKRIYVSPEIEKYIVRIVDATRFSGKYKLNNSKYIAWGSSPRASIGLYIASKADALLNGKDYVTPKNVKNVAYDILRHRIILNYEGQAENIKTDDIISEVLQKVPTP